MTSPDRRDPWAALATELGVGHQEAIPAEIRITETTTLGAFFAETARRGIAVDAGIGINAVASLRGWTSNMDIADTKPLLRVVQGPGFSYTPETFREFLSKCVPVAIDGVPLVTDPEDKLQKIDVHPSTSVFDFRNRMSALGIPLSAIAHQGIANAIEQYQEPKYGSGNPSLLGFLHQRGFTLQQLQEALQHVVPVVQGKKPFGRRTRQHRKAL